MRNMTEKLAMAVAMVVMVSLFVLGIGTVYRVAEEYQRSVAVEADVEMYGGCSWTKLRHSEGF